MTALNIQAVQNETDEACMERYAIKERSKI